MGAMARKIGLNAAILSVVQRVTKMLIQNQTKIVTTKREAMALLTSFNAAISEIVQVVLEKMFDKT
eukprot:12426363-Karenia_brevis.AAC.1